MGLFIVELMIDRLLEISTKTARVFRSFSPFNSSITRSDLNFALKFLLCLDMILNPLFHTDCSISDSLKSVRKSVLIYEAIIVTTFVLKIDIEVCFYHETNLPLAGWFA